MQPSAGTGEPITFRCPQERRDRNWARYDWTRTVGHHDVKRTGRVKKVRKRGQGLRHGNLAYEYVCACGHRGWTTHVDILYYPIKEES